MWWYSTTWNPSEPPNRFAGQLDAKLDAKQDSANGESENDSCARGSSGTTRPSRIDLLCDISALVSN